MAAPALILRRLAAPDYDDVLDAIVDEYRRTVADELLILAECQRLEKLEPLHVGGQWYPQSSRQFARKALAAKNVRSMARLRLKQRLAEAANLRGPRRCVWCNQTVREDQVADVLAGKAIHAGQCAREFAEFLHPSPLTVARGEG